MSALNEPRPPKPSNQGGAKPMGPKPPLRGGNSQKPSTTAGVKKGTTRPGVGGKGAKNNPPRM